ncbi:hypothetical protein AGLY_013949 [Aphis glycines]|uniref:Reverse transcriptase domain-containing protein n=1 Tax=Aphis glycines TaxID=307491 RepID=A0A6G0T4P5_APHGL|nr:hypothetical protein AGLY_013949 [Aphis glycines]
MPRLCGALDNKTENNKNGLLFGTWNERTLFKPGTAQNIVKEIEKYKLKIVALQEIRWDDTGTIKIVLCVLNAKVGKEAVFRPIIGSHSLHEVTNDNGLRLIDFVCGNGLVVKSTMFPNKNVYQGNTDVTRWKVVTESEIGKIKAVRKPWFNDICKDALHRRKEARNSWLNDQHNIKKEIVYKLCQKSTSRIFRNENPEETFKWTLVKPYDCESLPSTSNKIKQQIFRKKPIAEKIIRDYQGGFRPNRSTTDQIFVIRQTLQKMWEFNNDEYILFVDFKKAYDSIHWTSLINILREFKFPKKLVNLVEASINGTKIKVKLANMLSQPVEEVAGIRQEYALSTILFNLVLKKIVRKINLCEGAELGRLTINILAYRDDISLLERNREMIIKMGKSLIKTAEKLRLGINEENIENIVVSWRNGNQVQEEFIEVAEYKFKRVDQFKYLGAETWPLRKTEERRMAVFERKVLRKMYVVYFDVFTNEWRKLHNDELQSLFQRQDRLKEIKKRRLVWVRHTWRKHDSLIRRVIEENSVRRRPLGRPHLRCIRQWLQTHKACEVIALLLKWVDGYTLGTIGI